MIDQNAMQRPSQQLAAKAQSIFRWSRLRSRMLVALFLVISSTMLLTAWLNEQTNHRTNEHVHERVHDRMSALHVKAWGLAYLLGFGRLWPPLSWAETLSALHTTNFRQASQRPSPRIRRGQRSRAPSLWIAGSPRCAPRIPSNPCINLCIYRTSVEMGVFAVRCFWEEIAMGQRFEPNES